jgi:hypothetical protein
VKPEELLVKRVSNYMLDNHQLIPFRFDIGADVKLPVGVAKKLHALHGKRWRKGYPDLFVATCRGGYGGLYLELKATETVPDTEHTRTQASYHAVLRHHGYKVSFCCGFEDCTRRIRRYLRKVSSSEKVISTSTQTKC